MAPCSLRNRTHIEACGPPKTPEGSDSIPRVRSGNACVKASQEDTGVPLPAGIVSRRRRAIRAELRGARGAVSAMACAVVVRVVQNTLGLDRDDFVRSELSIPSFRYNVANANPVSRWS
jgi:hypothetical protein